jgi:uncharacterized membrane protein YhaH (DUF805 family)
MSRYSDTNQLPESVKTILRDALVFRGRSRRTDGLTYFFAAAVLSVIVHVVFEELTDFGTSELPLTIAAVAVQFPLIAWFVRRVHDYGMTGWGVVPFVAWMVVSSRLVTFVGIDPDALRHNLAFEIANPIVAIAFICAIFWKPDEGTNRFGPNPRFIAPVNELVSDER